MKKNKWILIFILLIISFIVLNHFLHIMDKSMGKNNRNNESLPLNTSNEGVSIFYDTLKKLGYSVKVDGKYFLKENHEGIYIITENKSSTGFKLKDAEGFIKKGGKIIYLTDKYTQYDYPNLIEKYKEKAYLYSLGRGKLLIGDIKLITNETLQKEKEGAYFILKWMDGLKGNIFFNEYFRFIQGQSPSLYRNLPYYIKIILLQLLFFLIGCILYFGKRFGKTKRMIDETERDENEYLYASANLYEKSGCIDTVYREFYGAFKNELKKTFKGSFPSIEWIHLWKKLDLPSKDEAIRVFQYEHEMENKNRKEALNMIKDMDKLTQILVKRREGAWSRLKQKN